MSKINPRPGMRILRRRGDVEWSSMVIGVVDAVHGGSDNLCPEVYGLHEAGRTFGLVALRHWPGPWFVREMDGDEPVIGNGLLAGMTAIDALKSAMKRYGRSFDSGSEAALLAKLKGEGS